MTSPDPTYLPDVIAIPASVATAPGRIDMENEYLSKFFSQSGLSLGEPDATLVLVKVHGDVVAVRDALASSKVSVADAVDSKPIPHVPVSVFLLHAT
jgi:hypothetical protein